MLVCWWWRGMDGDGRRENKRAKEGSGEWGSWNTRHIYILMTALDLSNGAVGCSFRGEYRLHRDHQMHLHKIAHRSFS